MKHRFFTGNRVRQLGLAIIGVGAMTMYSWVWSVCLFAGPVIFLIGFFMTDAPLKAAPPEEPPHDQAQDSNLIM